MVHNHARKTWQFGRSRLKTEKTRECKLGCWGVHSGRENAQMGVSMELGQYEASEGNSIC